MSMDGMLVRVTPGELEELKACPERAEPMFHFGTYRDHFKLDKMWQAVHFVLTGEVGHGPGTPPLGLAVFGGAVLGGEVGYGPIRCLTPEEVRDVDAALHAVGPFTIAQFDPVAFGRAEIYPANIWLEERPADLWDSLSRYLYGLSQYYWLAQFQHDAMLMGIT